VSPSAMPGRPPGFTVDHPMFERVCELFDAYRVHYGEPGDPAATGRWLRTQVSRQRLRVAAAIDEGRSGGGPAGTHQRVGGFITTAAVPASLTLGTAWLVRDLFVAKRCRRRGVARALLADTVAAARADGVYRLSLQTGTDNTAALRLYAAAGFRPVAGLELLNLIL
jgi:GNAT superfamily N-acetyltransferase